MATEMQGNDGMKYPAIRSNICGQGLVEYALLLALLAITAMVVVRYTGSKTAGTYDNIQSQMSGQSFASVTPQAPSGSGSSSSGGSGDSGGDHGDGGR